MSALEIVLVLSDSTLREYRVEGADTLELEVSTWDDRTRVIRASGIDYLEDVGTWELDALVRLPALDRSALQGYGLIDTEGNITMRFRASELDLGTPRA